MFDINELKKIFNLILVNKNISLSEDGLFSRDFLIQIIEIIKGKRPNDFELSKAQEDTLIKEFINGNQAFDNDTPQLIICNPNCIDIALKRDINSINYIDNITPDLEKKLIDLMKNSKYILHMYSPTFLKNNYDVALNSIRQDPNSANYVRWEELSQKEFARLIEDCISNKFS